MTQISPDRGPESRLDCFVFCWTTTKRLMAYEKSSYYRNRTSFWHSVYAFFEHRAFAEWVSFLNAPGREAIRDGDRHVWYKPLRGYMTTDWDSLRRVKVVKDSCAFILSNPGAARDVIVNRAGVVLARDPLGEAQGDLIIELNHQGRFKREGELSISVVCPDQGGELASIVFSYEQTSSGLVAYVGGLQGGLGGNPATVKSSPKCMAILALQCYLSLVGVTKILAVRDTRQMSNKKHMIKTPWNRITLSYDEAWAEGGGVVLDDSWFELPLNPSQKNREEIKPNKRGLYKRRCAMHARLSARIAAKAAGVLSDKCRSDFADSDFGRIGRA